MENLKQLIEEFVYTEELLNGFYGLEPARPVPRSPVSVQELEALSEHLRRLKLPFPPSYRAFLTISNGITSFDEELNLLSAKEVMNPVEASLKNDFPTLSRFIIALGNTSAFISFDSDTANKAGEMEVVWVMEDGGEFRYPNFGKFLEMILDQARETLKEEKADRDNLPND